MIKSVLRIQSETFLENESEDTRWVIIKYLPYVKEKWYGLELTRTERRREIHRRFQGQNI